MRTLNLGILAHVDAGKTSLTERLLYEAGVISSLGSVDSGNTQTDTLELERRRGITIKSAVVSFRLPDPIGGDDLVVNLIDTPGHPDFIAEVERVLGVLDAAVLVVSAVEGVQSQTRILSRALRRFDLPVLIFVNKIDRRGARPEAVIEEIRDRLDLLPLVLGSAHDVGTAQAGFRPAEPGDRSVQQAWAATLADHDDQVLDAWVEGTLDDRVVGDALARQAVTSDVQPLIMGSAMTGAGVDALRATLLRLTPPDEDGSGAPLSARVFAVQRGSDGRRVVLARVFAGVLRVRDRVFLGEREAKITALELVEDGDHQGVDSVGPGRIARLRGLSAARIGDVITQTPGTRSSQVHTFAPPALETIIEPVDPARTGALFNALTELADSDPLINFRRGREDALAVSLYGEVQKEVIGATLEQEYGIRTTFATTRPICVERVIGVGESITALSSEDNPFLAGIGLRVEPGPAGSGIRYTVDGFMLGTLPPAFFTAIEETVPQTLQEGLRGWQVIDCVVTLIHTGYYPRQSHAHATFDKSMSSTAGDFRLLTPLVIMEALTTADTEVLEPVHRFSVDLPYASLSAVLGLITGLGGIPTAEPHGREWRIHGEIPAAAVHTVNQRLPGLTSGEGAWESEAAGYRPTSGPVPERARTDHDPLHRKEYLLRVQRRQLNA